MSYDDKDLEWWPEDKGEKHKSVRFFKSKSKANDDDVQYRYVAHAPSSPKKEPVIWLGRTKAEVQEDKEYIAARQAAKEKAEEVYEVTYRRKPRSPSPEPVEYRYISTSKWQSRAPEEREAEDAKNAGRYGLGPPPKRRPPGPVKSHGGAHFWVLGKSGYCRIMTYSDIRALDGFWSCHPERADPWFFVED